jgi:hypothetical protein
LNWSSGHAATAGDPLAGWHVSPDGVEDSGQHNVPSDVNCESGQDAATPPPGSWQVSSPVGVEPGAQQASVSAVIGPEQVGVAFAWSMFVMPEPTTIIVAMIVVRIAAKTFWRGPEAARFRVVPDRLPMRLNAQIKQRMCESQLKIYRPCIRRFIGGQAGQECSPVFFLHRPRRQPKCWRRLCDIQFRLRHYWLRRRRLQDVQLWQRHCWLRR